MAKESNIDCLASIRADVDVIDCLACLGNFIQDISGTGIIPFAQDSPSGHVVGRNQDSESVGSAACMELVICRIGCVSHIETEGVSFV